MTSTLAAREYIVARIEAIRRPPDNFEAFVEEISAGLEKLYGPAAAEDYRNKAPVAIQSSVIHPAVRTWVARDEMDDGVRAQAILMSAIKDGLGHITFVHVLAAFVGLGLEGELARNAVAHLKQERVLGITAEPVALCRLDLDDAFTSLGFEKIERQLMAAPSHSRHFSAALLPESVTVDSRDYGHVAQVIVEAYGDHPGRGLHAEVRSLAGAETFVRTAADGAYGQTRPGFIRMIRRGGKPVGAVVACEAAPGVGFVLQIVVSHEFRGQGMGTRLMLEIANIFREAGFTRMALGVTNDNPARRLYERLGFRKIMPVNAYVWWK